MLTFWAALPYSSPAVSRRPRRRLRHRLGAQPPLAPLRRAGRRRDPARLGPHLVRRALRPRRGRGRRLPPLQLLARAPPDGDRPPVHPPGRTADRKLARALTPSPAAPAVTKTASRVSRRVTREPGWTHSSPAPRRLHRVPAHRSSSDRAAPAVRSRPAGAAAVQELLGGRFGEMSTLMNYTFQSFNFRDRQGARPFYDLLANIAAEEFGHIELVAATINTMLTGATPAEPGQQRPRAASAHVGQGRGQPASLHRRRPGCASAELAGSTLERRLRLLVRRPGRGSDAQLLPRDRRPQQQAEGLRDGGAPGRPGTDRATCSSAAASTRSPTHARSST